MDETKQKIISLFKSKGCEISTGEILNYVFPDYEPLKLKKDEASKRKVAQAHRKLLYHINELVSDGLLRFSRFGEKGTKFFVLDIDSNEELTELSSRFKKRMIVSKPMIPAMPIETYEHQGIIIKYSAQTWIDKLNSIVLFCNRISSIKELNKVFDNSISLVNDCICFENFEFILKKYETKDILNFFEKVNLDCEEYKKKVSLIINSLGIVARGFKEIIEKALDYKENINIIFNLASEEIQEQFSILSEIINMYIKKKGIIYIKNKRVQKLSYFLGEAGPYCFSDRDMPREHDYLALACSQSALIVDVEKFYSIYGLDVDKFSQLMLNVSRAFLSANTLQRRKSQEYFKDIINLDKKNEKEFLELSRNYIRLWNFGLLQPGIDPKLVNNMISEAKKKIDQFSIAEETIYKSCGMPLRFKIALSCAFKESNEKLSPAKYKKLEINSIEDLYKPKIKKEIIEKENITFMFDGGNDITFHRNGSFNSEDIIRELSFIMNTYKMPLFSYNFQNIKGNMKITSFFE